MRLGNYYITWRYDNRQSIYPVTVCNIENTPGGIGIWFGVARCSAYDRFTKEYGRKISLTRAMKAAGLNKQERTLIWKDYFNRKKS